MHTLTKTQRILDRTHVTDSHISFRLVDGETAEPATGIMLDRETYDDLGQPDMVTVTVEPGDLLNS